MPRAGGKYLVGIGSLMGALAALRIGWLLAGGPTVPEPDPPAVPSVEPAGREEVPHGRAQAETGASVEKPASGPLLEGIPEVIDTVTLRVGESLVRLYGVEWARGGKAEDLSHYLQGRRVQCAPMNDAYRCTVGTIDLSRAVLFNGGARAKADAPPELHAAERRARAERLGVWQRDQSLSRQ
jgi:hypothetical protein